ncbi:MAG: MATE family efflux transporter [Parasporobacterium sp.]|nr:MATE family efflux transporter [Parasporobacterium sp.]
MNDVVRDNPLGNARVNRLIIKYAVPSIVAMMIVGMYNIVDQLFIGNVIGELGNAATNIAFPLTSICLALGLLFGIGGAASFNLKLGAGEKEEAPYYIGNAVTVLIICGILLLLIVEIFLEPILRMFGSPESVLPYAMDYTRIIAVGFPFTIFSSGASHLLRADGRPNLAMVCNIIGGAINIGLDAWFILGLRWGMAGAAGATVIGQVVAGIFGLVFVIRGKTFRMKLKHYLPRLGIIGRSASLGLAPMVNQLSMMIVQIILNNSLRFYGGQSIYGEAIPIACAGIISKVGSIFAFIVIGLAQGSQPIISFNYGAGNYARVKEAYYRSLIIAFVASLIGFIIFQTIPDKILLLFGNGSDLYFEFGSLFFRRFYFMICLFFIQMISSNFFTAIGKPWKGIFLSLTRQVLYLIPLMLVFPRFLGVYGIIYAQPTADILAITTAILMMVFEFRRPEYRSTKGVFKSIFIKDKPRKK